MEGGNVCNDDVFEYDELFDDYGVMLIDGLDFDSLSDDDDEDMLLDEFIVKFEKEVCYIGIQQFFCYLLLLKVEFYKLVIKVQVGDFDV